MKKINLFAWGATVLLASTPLAGDEGAEQSAREVEQAIHLDADAQRGREVYGLCAVCHMPEGWGQIDGAYPQIAGQLSTVIIKQLADIRARNRDTPTMLPFAMLEHLGLQQIADVAAYISSLPMTPHNGAGPGTDLARGEKSYAEYCADCHGERGEGISDKFMPRIQGQHYEYLVRQFRWIRDGKRRNGDKEMIDQIKGFSDGDVSAIMDYVSRLRPLPGDMADADWQNPDFPEFVRPQAAPSVSD